MRTPIRAALVVLFSLLLAGSASAQATDEAALRQKLQSEPQKADHYFALARLFEDQGRCRDAEVVLLQAGFKYSWQFYIQRKLP